MIAAIYARRSTDQHLPDAEKSVARQIQHGRDYAVRKGWTVDERHVYSDDGVSGGEFQRRPGFLRLMNALRPRAPFDVLVLMDEDRLGRESIDRDVVGAEADHRGRRARVQLPHGSRTHDCASPASGAASRLRVTVSRNSRRSTTK
jgi:DNA invertase Pin-like site-specific DNA recombinase